MLIQVPFDQSHNSFLISFKCDIENVKLKISKVKNKFTSFLRSFYLISSTKISATKTIDPTRILKNMLRPKIRKYHVLESGPRSIRFLAKQSQAFFIDISRETFLGSLCSKCDINVLTLTFREKIKLI